MITSGPHQCSKAILGSLGCGGGLGGASMCILSVKMAAEAVSKLPQDFTGGKDLRTEALAGLDRSGAKARRLRKETIT